MRVRRIASAASVDRNYRRSKRVFFIRHGQSVANQRKRDTPAERDAVLTELGRRQASCWNANNALSLAFGGDAMLPEVCVCSPLRRAMETAALVFENEPGVPIECTRLARERWWMNYQCIGVEYAETSRFAREELGRRVDGLEGLELLDKYWNPKCELEEIARMESENARVGITTEPINKFELSVREQDADHISELTKYLIAHEASSIAIACHWGVINLLTGMSPNNCDIVVADLDLESHSYSVVGQYQPPGNVEKSI